MSHRGPLLFVAREPDETLRTFLPVLAELRRRGRDCLVLFHHQPGGWALERLSELGVPLLKVELPPLQPAGGLTGRLGWGAAAGELLQLRRARQLGYGLIERLQPAAAVVIQDTLLLERFLVRAANERGHGTLVVQWAFTFPQTTYDLLNDIQRGRTRSKVQGPRSKVGGPVAAIRRGIYRLAQRLLGVRFELVRSYGGGEARAFAVMGEAFRDQFIQQGVRKERIEVTGHPSHDAAFALNSSLTPERVTELKAAYGLPTASRVILYATQPVLWRGVVTRQELVENVRSLGRAVSRLGPDFLLLLKLHPREQLEEYAGVEHDGLPISLVKEGEVSELIGLAEAFISSSSSTVLQAMMLDKPIVTVNFNQVPHFDYYETVGGTLHVRSPEVAEDALRQAVFDEPTRARLAAERAKVLARYARFDGQAASRLADLVEELSN